MVWAFILSGRKTVVTDVVGDHDSKNQESTVGDFGAPHCSCFFSYSASRYSYSYSIRSSIAILPIGPQVPAKPPRSTIGIAAVQTAIEYEYRFTEYRPPQRTEYEYDEIRGEARAHAL